MSELLHQDVTNAVINGAIEVHRELGPGLLESAYEACLHHTLTRDGITVQRQVTLPIFFDGQRIDAGYRIDLLVDNSVIVELKSVDELEPVHEAQLLTYLRLSGYRVGLLMNFNKKRMRDGIKRLIL